MNRYFFALVTFIIIGSSLIGKACYSQTLETDYTQFVDPFIGTGGNGHTFPGATVPFGMVQLSPNTGNYSWDYFSGYQYNDTTVRGFAHTHLSGGGLPILGDLLMLPFTNDKALTNKCVPFSKKQEKASPGYYSTYLTDDKILVELTAGIHMGVQRYTFEKDGESNILINLDEVLFRGTPEQTKVKEAYFTFLNDSVITGLQRTFHKRTDRRVYFAIQLSKAFLKKHFIDSASQRKLVLSFKLKPGEQIEIRCAISMVDEKGAMKNLTAEGSGKTFDKIKNEASAEWNKYLSRINIKGDKKQKVQFYTGMYHLFIQPNRLDDVDGKYRGADDKIHVSHQGGMYSTFAFWDIYRAAFPFYTMIIPEKIEPFVSSIIAHYDQVGYLPVWSFWGRDTWVMLGNHAVPVITEAYLKGLYPDGEKAFEAIKETLTKNHWPKYNWELYNKYGYMPSDAVRHEAVSRTLEAAYDDWCAAQLAKALNKKDDYEFFINRSGFYKNLFDPETKFMRGKTKDGKWNEPFDPIKICHAGTSNGDYTEANAWHYMWHVQHDVEGLIDLFGGKEIFSSKIDTLLKLEPVIIGDGNTKDVSGLIGQYAHGNEPCQHIPYLYNYTGEPHKTQDLVRKTLETMYNTTPEGYCGNNDFGQMSAWYILSGMGFYPVHPASGMLDIGIPLFEHASIQVNGKTFEIKTKNFSSKNKYVKSVKLNGKTVSSFKISYDDIMNGGVLEFELTDSY